MYRRIKNFFRAKSADLGGLDFPSSELMRALGAASTISKKSITADTAKRAPAVHQACTIIEEALATVSFNLFERDGDGGRRRATEHPVHGLVNKSANKFKSAGRFRAEITDHALTHGFGVAAVSRVRGGKPFELIPFRPGSVSITEDQESGELIFKLNGKGGGKVLNRRDLIFIPATASDGFKFESLIKRCREAIALLLILEEAKARLFANGSQIPGFFAMEKDLPAEATALIMEAFKKETVGVENYGKTPLIPWAVTHHKVGMNNVDSAIVEIYNQQIVEVARAFSLPVFYLQDLSRATWNNAAAQARAFYSFCLASWIERFEAAYNQALLTAEERERFYIEADVSSLLASDPLQQAQAMQILISSRVLAPAEARERLNLPKADDKHNLDSFMNPNTMPALPPIAQDNNEREENERAREN